MPLEQSTDLHHGAGILDTARERKMQRIRAASILLAVSSVACADALRVLVTGAGGRTGRLVFEQLSGSDDFEARGLVRSAKAQKALKKVGATDEAIVRADVALGKEAGDTLTEAMQGCDAVVLCTSATPKIKPLSILKVLWKKKVLRSSEPGRPSFSWPERGTPEEVDWLGAKRQIDAAVSAGVKQFVMVSSMGGTQRDNFLNSIGRRADGSGGDILLWKRKAEKYLVDSKLKYTIVHPGGLVDKPGGERELTVGVDDTLMEGSSRQVCRADVARVCCAALTSKAAENKSFDLASKPEGEGTPTADAEAVFAALGGRNAKYDGDGDDPPSIMWSKLGIKP